jgi:Pherophorin
MRRAMASAATAAKFPYCPCQRSASKSGLYVAPQVEFTAKGSYCFTIRNDGKAKTGQCANQNMYKFELDASEYVHVCMMGTVHIQERACMHPCTGCLASLTPQCPCTRTYCTEVPLVLYADARRCIYCMQMHASRAGCRGASAGNGLGSTRSGTGMGYIHWTDGSVSRGALAGEGPNAGIDRVQ